MVTWYSVTIAMKDTGEPEEKVPWVWLVWEGGCWIFLKWRTSTQYLMDQERAHQINTNKKVVGCRNRMYKFLVATWKLHFCWSGTWVGALKDILIKHEVHLALSSICCAQPQEKNIVDIRWPCTADKAETWLHPKVPAGRNSLTRNGVSEGTWIYCFNLRSVHIYEFEAIKPYALPNDLLLPIFHILVQWTLISVTK